VFFFVVFAQALQLRQTPKAQDEHQFGCYKK